MEVPNDIKSLIDAWPTIGAFADDLGCGYEAARQMRRRNSIAPEHWPQVVAASERRGLVGVDLSWLAQKRVPAPQEAAE